MPSVHINELTRLGFNVEMPSPLHVNISGRLGTVNDFIEEIASKRIQHELLTNSTEAVEQLIGKEALFKGGTYEDLAKALSGDMPLDLFEKAKAQFDGSDIGKVLRTKTLQLNPKRKRVVSEHDGDWDYSRRWDVRSFNNARRAYEERRCIDIICDFSIAGSADAASITKYGATAWAISDLIERAGIKTRVLLQNRAEDICLRRAGASTTIDIELKRPGEYLAPSLMAGAMTAVFFRRATFAMFVSAADCIGDQVNYGLGRPTFRKHGVKFEDGKLILTANMISGFDKDLEREILKAVGIAVPEAKPEKSAMDVLPSWQEKWKEIEAGLPKPGGRNPLRGIRDIY